MKPSDIPPGAIYADMQQRAEDLDHLIAPVQEDLENKIVQSKLNDDYDFLETVTELMDTYNEQGAYGRMFVLGSLRNIIEQLEEAD